jgi:hypothetical protein
MQPLPRAGEATFLGDGQEHLELSDVHRASGRMSDPYRKRMDSIT